MAEPKEKAGIGGTIVVIIIVGAFIVGLYLTLTRGKRENKFEPAVTTSEASNLLAKDLAANYPGTAREVMKTYCRITQCLYSEELEDDEIEKLIDQLRVLYSDELLAINDRDSMISLARGEIKHYNSNNMTINSYHVEESGEITYYRNDNPPRAIVDIYFTIKTDKEFSRSYEEFVLIQNDDGQWKILGWRQSEG